MDEANDITKELRPEARLRLGFFGGPKAPRPSDPDCGGEHEIRAYHAETMVETIYAYIYIYIIYIYIYMVCCFFTEESSFQGFLGHAK